MNAAPATTGQSRRGPGSVDGSRGAQSDRGDPLPGMTPASSRVFLGLLAAERPEGRRWRPRGLAPPPYDRVRRVRGGNEPSGQRLALQTARSPEVHPHRHRSSRADGGEPRREQPRREPPSPRRRRPRPRAAPGPRRRRPRRRRDERLGRAECSGCPQAAGECSSPGGPAAPGGGEAGVGEELGHPQPTLNPPSTPCARPTTGGLARVATGAGEEGVGEELGRPLTTR